jgi:hypothetical protein
MQKQLHAKDAKDAKAKQKMSVLQPADDSLFGERFLKPTLPIPLRSWRTLREVCCFNCMVLA